MQEYLKKEIKHKKELIKELRSKIKKATTCEEVRSLGDTLEKVLEELEEAKEKLTELENDGPSEPSEGEEGDSASRSKSGRKVNPIDFMRGNQSFNLNTGEAFSGVADTIELRKSGQKFSDKYKTVQDLNLGKYIRGLVTGDWTDAEAEKRSVTTSSVGTIIPTVLSAQVLDTAFNKSIFLNSDVPVVPMTSNNLTYARIKKIGTPTFVSSDSSTSQFNEKQLSEYFKEEMAEGKEIDFNLENVTLKAKTCYTYAYVSLESLHSAENLNEILIEAFSNAIATGIDKAFLYGVYNSESEKYETFAPDGILNDADILTIESTKASWDDYIKAVSKIKKYNGLPTSYAINSQTEELLNLLKTTEGQYLEKPKSLDILSPVVTNQLESDPTKGNTSLVYDKDALIVGMQVNLNVRMITDSDYCVKHGAVGFQIYSMLDCKTLYPQKICKITGIK